MESKQAPMQNKNKGPMCHIAPLSNNRHDKMIKISLMQSLWNPPVQPAKLVNISRNFPYLIDQMTGNITRPNQEFNFFTSRIEMFAYTFNLTKRFTLDKILAYCKGRLKKEKMEDEILKIRSQTGMIFIFLFIKELYFNFICKKWNKTLKNL